ncbi:magnesium chelatase, subunit chlI domain-containing protein [Ditylenchus destructor]|uniref:Magnesium chelatase, subunit chlI domain-containing protein n=1 Tax=Ditylenchus destructor TaxID=166010 RepID=A0AAD4MFS9_9BILA|nr:magnesium chelatase, subunit chlI domain-containing protein [Ditylenchus destructor]
MSSSAKLGLDGRIAPSPGVLLAALHAAETGKGLVCPVAQGPEAAWAGTTGVIAAPDLIGLINHFKGQQLLGAPQAGEAEEAPLGPDLRQVKGQETAKRALEIAAAGGHNLLMVGPPGAGKSLMASCLPGILPPLDASEALEVSMVASVAGDASGRQAHADAAVSPARITPRRWRRSPAAGSRSSRGRVSMAHLGVLFLDELPEFQRAVLDSLRRRSRAARSAFARANAHVTFPARVQLVAAMNPCRCGHLGDPALACARAPKCAADYQAKVSGPLLDRIDLHVDVAAGHRRRSGAAATCRRIGRGRGAGRGGAQGPGCALQRLRYPHQCRGGRAGARRCRDTRRARPQAARAGGGGDADVRARLYPRAARRENDRRSGTKRNGRSYSRRGSAELPSPTATILGESFGLKRKRLGSRNKGNEDGMDDPAV